MVIGAKMSMVFMIVALAVASLVILSDTLVPVIARSYKSKDFESDWEAALARDPKMGQAVELSFGNSLPNDAVVIMMGDCTPCGISRIDKIPNEIWRTKRIVIVASTPDGLAALREKGIERVCSRLSVASVKDIESLNSFFVPRAFHLKKSKLIAIQSPNELLADFVKRESTP